MLHKKFNFTLQKADFVFSIGLGLWKVPDYSRSSSGKPAMGNILQFNVRLKPMRSNTKQVTKRKLFCIADK